MFDFHYLGKINVDETILNLNRFTEIQWSENSARKEKYDVHKNTDSLSILWHEDSIFTGEPGRKHENNFNQINFDNIQNQLLPLYNEKYGSGKILRALITRLNPNSNILPHKDGGDSLLEVNRTHIPLITNSQILFTVGNVTKNLKVGEVWEIDNSNIHSVVNNSNECRVHLIVDYLKNDDYKTVI